MSDLPSSESSPRPGSTPPPLPHKALLFKLGWRLGFWFGAVQTFFLLLILVLSGLSPGGLPPLGVFVAAAGAALQAFSAYYISKHSAGGRSLFTLGTVCVSFCDSIAGGIIFGILNLIPLMLLVASSSPDVAPKAQKSDPLETAGLPSSTESSAAKEDLY